MTLRFAAMLHVAVLEGLKRHSSASSVPFHVRYGTCGWLDDGERFPNGRHAAGQTLPIAAPEVERALLQFSCTRETPARLCAAQCSFNSASGNGKSCSRKMMAVFVSLRACVHVAVHARLSRANNDRSHS